MIKGSSIHTNEKTGAERKKKLFVHRHQSRRYNKVKVTYLLVDLTSVHIDTQSKLYIKQKVQDIKQKMHCENKVMLTFASLSPPPLSLCQNVQ